MKEDENKKTNKEEHAHECGGCGGGCHSDKEIEYTADNILHGPYSTYDPVDDILTEGECSDGRQHGPYKEFYGMDRKQIKTDGGYKDGLLHGAWTFYNKDGSVEKVEVYQEGKLIESR